MDEQAILKRIDELLALASTPGLEGTIKQGELYQGTLSLLATLKGAASAELLAFRESIATVTKGPNAFSTSVVYGAINHSVGTLKNLRAEIEAGLIGSLRAQIVGEVLTDFIGLARQVLETSDQQATNVAAVLAAAAFEDTIRRIASTAGLPHQEKLADTLTDLKQNGALKGSEVGIAQSYLSFRNKALHAQWETLDRPSVSSVLAFTEQLILRDLT